MLDDLDGLHVPEAPPELTDAGLARLDPQGRIGRAGYRPTGQITSWSEFLSSAGRDGSTSRNRTLIALGHS